jgi:phosphatidylinositol alpha-mannosyltransferase
MERAEKALGRALGVNCNSYSMPQADRVMVYTEYYRDHLVQGGYVPADRIDVVPIFSLAPSVELKPRPRPRRIGFVARDFTRKGGNVVLAAYRRVKELRPDSELWIVGSPPEMSKAEADRLGITWLDVVSRERLLNEVMPGFDVFAYPTPHDCFSYVMLEAMSCGAAIATSDYVSMPEAVDYGKAGLISPVGDPEKLAANILSLLEPETNWKFRLAARRRFEEYFSWEAVTPRILDNYERALSAHVKLSVAINKDAGSAAEMKCPA